MKRKIKLYLSSKVALRVCCAVFLSILFIEIIIFFPSYYKREGDLLQNLGDMAQASIDVILQDLDSTTSGGSAIPTQRLLNNRRILGVLITQPDGTVLSQAGQSRPLVDWSALNPATNRRSSDGNVYDVHWRAGSAEGGVEVWLRLDSSWIQDDQIAFAWRIAGLVMIISVVVTAASYLVIFLFVLRPVLSLKDALQRDKENIARLDSLNVTKLANDEIGEITATFANLMSFASEHYRDSLIAKDNRFQDFALVSSDWFWEMDSDLRFSYFSERFTEVTGVPVQALLGKTREENGNPGATDADWKSHLNALHTHQEFRDFRHPRTKPDGSVVWLSISGRPYFDPDGAFQGFRGSGRDITSIVNSERNLVEARDAAEQSSKAKSEFLASMSHEIRTPMTSVLGLADLLLGEDLSTQAKDRVGKIKWATQSLLRIINDILDLSKMQAGKLEIEAIDFNLPSAIQDSLGLFESSMEARGKSHIALECEFSENFPLVINSDQNRLRQILVNLIGNAIKFTQNGRVKVIGERIVESDQDLIQISVCDTGIGIDPASLEALFDDFAQADASISRRFEGTGLGLSISKRLVELMGGEIGAQSSVGEGSTFWFTLPFRPAVSLVPETSKDKTASKTFKGVKRLQILVAEDNLLNQQIIVALLGGLGHIVEVVGDGSEAIIAHRKHDFDLIVSDIRMPGMSGTDAARAIRQLDQGKGEIPIVALTADAMEENVKEYLSAGINAVVTKPIDLADLAKKINDVMGEAIHIPMETDQKTQRQPNPSATNPKTASSNQSPCTTPAQNKNSAQDSSTELFSDLEDMLQDIERTAS